MKTYWDRFIKEYKNEIPYVSTCKLLEAFFFYIKRNETKEVDRIMGK